MGVRDRLRTAYNAAPAGVQTRIDGLRKAFGPGVPAAVTAGEAAAGMTPTRPFSPGEPIGPYDGFSRTPRTQNFVTGVNIATRPRTHERVSFETLRGLVESYDVAQMCIWHRIDSIRSLEWSLIPAPGHQGDVADLIPIGMAALAKPDRDHPFSVWLATWLYDILAYDAGTLYRLRNRRGDAIGLRTVDGTTIAPLLDYWGNTPKGDDPDELPPAYVQYANGLPWNWLTVRDLIYSPFRKRTNSPYGFAPLESILLNANTDLRFQAYFLQRFTDGNIPEAFASAPESWTPQQIEDFQGYWDAAMYGDQAAKHQVKWLPGGSAIAWSNEKDFTDAFSLFLMRKTAAAYHVVPADLGFTESVNRSSGESQADVQHRVGDLPLIRHIQTILSSFLQDDLGLPLQFAFDLGEEQADRVEQAQADKIYVEMGAVSASDVREMRYGLPEPDGRPVPRFVFTTHAGPIPLASLYAVAGDIDPETAAPEPGTQLPHTVFGNAEGVVAEPPIKVMPLAEQIYGPEAMPPAPPPQPQTPPEPVAKDGPTAGITSQTGITGYDLDGQHDDEDDPEGQCDLVKAELAAFRSFRKARVRAGRWRDFEFRHVPPGEGQLLNEAGRIVAQASGTAVRKAGDGGPKAPDGDAWPGWEHDQRVSDHWAPLIAAALLASLSLTAATAIAARYRADRPGADDTSRRAQVAAVAGWLAAQGIDAGTALVETLTGLHSDAYLVGVTSALAAVDGGRAQIGDWTPGDTAAAHSHLDQLGAAAGLAVALAAVDEAAEGIARSRMTDVARAIIDGTDAGLTDDDLAETLRDALADEGRAQAVAVTETTAASSAGALDVYQQQGVTLGRWQTEGDRKVCPTCLGNEAAGPVPIGQPYPSGDLAPPGHARCRCAVIPA